MASKRYGRSRDKGSDPTRSEIARRAVERLADGRERPTSESISDALDNARRELRLPEGTRHPKRSELRAHAQAHEESLGPEVRVRRIRATYEEILEILAALEALVLQQDRDGISRPSPEVYGRAAVGELDLDPVVHIRVTTMLPIAAIANVLVTIGLAEPSFTTLESRVGRLDRIDTASTLAEYRILRLPPKVPVDPELDLVRGVRVPHARFEEISRRIS